MLQSEQNSKRSLKPKLVIYRLSKSWNSKFKFELLSHHPDSPNESSGLRRSIDDNPVRYCFAAKGNGLCDGLSEI